MQEDTISALPDPSGFSSDPLTEVLRTGARRLIEQAVDVELLALLAAYADETTEDGRSRLVRHGHLPEREVMTGLGPVAVKVPRVRDCGSHAEKVRFTSSILPAALSAQGEIGRGVCCHGYTSRASRRGIFRKR